MKRVKYISHFSSDLTSRDITELAAKSARNNARDGITGVLMASDNIFFQIIEGDDEAVNRLMARLRRDDRHKQMVVLSVEDGIARRLFPEWTMKGVDVSSKSSFAQKEALSAILETIFTQKRLVQNLTQVLERTIWQQFVGL